MAPDDEEALPVVEAPLVPTEDPLLEVPEAVAPEELEEAGQTQLPEPRSQLKGEQSMPAPPLGLHEENVSQRPVKELQKPLAQSELAEQVAQMGPPLELAPPVVDCVAPLVLLVEAAVPDAVPEVPVPERPVVAPTEVDPEEPGAEPPVEPEPPWPFVPVPLLPSDPKGPVLADDVEFEVDCEEHAVAPDRVRASHSEARRRSMVVSRVFG